MDDGIPCLPTRNELKTFYLHEDNLADLMFIVGTGFEAKHAGRNNIDHEIASNNKTSTKAGSIIASPTPGVCNNIDVTTCLDGNKQDGQRCNLPEHRNLSLSPHPPQGKDAPPQSILPITSIPQPISSGGGATDSKASVYKFIITGALMNKTSNQRHQKLAQRWLLQANERLEGIKGIRLENVQVDGKRSTERIITVTSNFTTTETKKKVLKALKGWSSIETVFEEEEYPEWVVTGVPSGDPLEIAERIAQTTNTILGPRKPMFLVRGYATGTLRFCTIPETNPGKTVKLGGKSLGISRYGGNRHGGNHKRADQTPSSRKVAKTICFKCRKNGHLSAECPRRAYVATQPQQ